MSISSDFLLSSVLAILQVQFYHQEIDRMLL